MDQTWADRAEAAERAVLTRHVRRWFALPGTALGAVRTPAPAFVTLGRWHYWWQAHLLDCTVDAYERAPTTMRRARSAALARTIGARNLGWRNNYFDDMAWLGLALDRCGEVVGARHRAAVRRLVGTLRAAWSDEAGGGIPWRRGDDFRNVPANGPAAILLARTGHLAEAAATADWIAARLMDPTTGLAQDGIRPGGVREPTVYTYNQGTVLGAGTELAVRTGEARHAARVHRLVAAVGQHLGTAGAGSVLRGHGGGDGGLFTGILARYLALVATSLPPRTAADAAARTAAAGLVLSSARAVWSHRIETAHGPVFGADWSRPAGTPDDADLSVQLGAWMLLEAAARTAR